MVGPLAPALAIGLSFGEEEARQLVGIILLVYYLIFLSCFITWISIIDFIQKRTLS
jgi:hypothetical protein